MQQQGVLENVVEFGQGNMLVSNLNLDQKGSHCNKQILSKNTNTNTNMNTSLINNPRLNGMPPIGENNSYIFSKFPKCKEDWWGFIGQTK